MLNNRLETVQLVEGDVDKVIEYMLNGEGRHKTFNRLAELGDTFGHRMSGTQVLEDVIGL